jgi:transaldolase
MDAIATESPLLRMARSTATDYWNDSCAVEELEYAIERGAVGATSNPVIVLEVLGKAPERWRARACDLYAAHPTWSESDLAWQIVEEIAVEAAALLMPVMEASRGVSGRLSIQTNPTLYRDSEAMLAQALHFAGLAPNIQVKLPVTSAGLVAIEEATARGVNVNATINFTVPGALAVAEAVERGLDRYAREGRDPADLHPVCTIMVGRLDDWLKALAERELLLPTPGVLDWAGVAVVKRAYQIYRGRGFRTRLLAGAYRSHLPWSQLIGGDIVLTIPHAWQQRFESSRIEPRERMSEPVPSAVLDELLAFDDFRRAYEPEGLSPASLQTYGAAIRTLRQFISAYHELLATIRDFVLPSPGA